MLVYSFDEQTLNLVEISRNQRHLQEEVKSFVLFIQGSFQLAGADWGPHFTISSQDYGLSLFSGLSPHLWGMSDQAAVDAEHSALPGNTFACPWLSLGSRGSFWVPTVLSTPCRDAGKPRHSPCFLKVPVRLLRNKAISRLAVLPYV